MACNTGAKPACGNLPSVIVTAYQCNSAWHTSSRVAQADAAGAHYNTKAWRCVHRSKHGDGMVQDRPDPKKGTKNDEMKVHIGQW